MSTPSTRTPYSFDQAAAIQGAAFETYEALLIAREWLRGDKWRNSTSDKHSAWVTTMRMIDAAIAKAQGGAA